MSEDANPVETTPAPEAAPESQPVQGSETPVATPAPAEVTPQGRENQQSLTIPKWRFDEVNHRAQQAERELAQLRQPQQQPQPAPEPTAPKPADYETYEDYVRAEARFTAQQEARQVLKSERQREQEERRAQDEQTRAQSIHANWSQKANEARTKYPDFDEKLSMAPILHPIAQQVLKNAQNAGELGYHLASNPDLIARVNGMHPLDMAAELGRIEGKLQGSTGQPIRKPSAGIPALTPVGAGTKPGNIDPYATTTSVEDYVRATRPLPKRK